MAFINLGLGASPHPEHIKPSSGVQEEQHVTQFDRWLPWTAWRDVTNAAPDSPPSEETIPDPLIIDMRGCLGLHIVATTEALTVAGLLTNITDWSARLWVCCGPPTVAQWAIYEELGAQGTSSLHKFYSALPGLWYAALQVYSVTGAGTLKVSGRQV